MRVVYCIICHENSPILKETVDILSKNNDIYIHVDKKSDINTFTELESKVYFLKKRLDVKWGSFSQIEVMIELLQQTKLGTYDYISIISGDDLPLKTDVKIKEFLEENSGKEFIGIQKNNDKLEDRVKYLYNNFYFKKNRYFFEKIYVYMQSKSKLYKKNPYYKDLPKLYKGSNWFTITSKLRDYILDYIEKNPNYVKAFEKSLCCDEVFFQTIVYNSPYLENIYNEKENNDNLNSLRYIDWESGPEYPKVLVEEDFNKIKKSNCLFARKFNKNINLDKYREIFQNKNIN